MLSRLTVKRWHVSHHQIGAAAAVVLAASPPSSSLMGGGGGGVYYPRRTQQQQQQHRWRWTKAKKKRQARWERRKELAEKGIDLPKPPGYFPRDKPVVNAQTRDEKLIEIQRNDEQVSQELHTKLVAAQHQPVLRHHMTGLRMSDKVRQLFALHNGSQREVIAAQKQRGMQVFQLREGDTGSSAVQVIALTTRIQQMQTHLTKHKKDKHGKKGMDALLIRRRKLLDYMERRDFESYRRVVKTLGLVRS